MNANKSLSAVGGYLGAHVASDGYGPRGENSYPAVTITRQAGARAISVGGCLLKRLSTQPSAEGAPSWSLWENQILEHVLEENDLPQDLVERFPESQGSYIEDTVDDILGHRPSAFVINQKCHELMERLCIAGHVIIIGRAANLLLARCRNALHVRLVGSQKKRVQHLAQSRSIGQRRALAHLKREDLQRERYARLNFDCPNIDEPLLYDLTLNTDELDDHAAAAIIEIALRSKVPQPVPRADLPLH